MNKGMTALRACHGQYMQYIKRDPEAHYKTAQVMSFEEDIGLLVEVMKTSFGANMIDIAKNSHGFNSFSALPISKAQTGTARLLESWSSMEAWVTDMMTGPNQGHLFMDQEDWEEEVAEVKGVDDDEASLIDDLASAAQVAGTDQDQWVKNAMKSWEAAHIDKEGPMNAQQAAQARELLTRHASRVKVLCAQRYAAAEKEEQASRVAQIKEHEKAAQAEASIEAYEAIEWSVEAIRGKRIHLDHGLQYKVQWKNCGRDEDTWENAENVAGCPRLVAEFEARSDKIKRGKKLNKVAKKPKVIVAESSSDTDDEVPLGSLYTK